MFCCWIEATDSNNPLCTCTFVRFAAQHLAPVLALGLHSSCHLLSTSTLLLTLLFILALHSTIIEYTKIVLAIDGNRSHWPEQTSMRAGSRSLLGESPTCTLGRNDRGVTPTGESFIPLTPSLITLLSGVSLFTGCGQSLPSTTYRLGML